jgi:hypothetical protein
LKTTIVACALVCLASAPALAQEPAPSPAPYEVPPLPPVPSPPPPVRWIPDPPVAPAASPFASGGAPRSDRAEAATAPTAPRSFQVDVGMATEFPISMGGYLGAELPGRLLLQVGAGVMPGAYSGAINGVLTSVGAYDGTVGTFIQNALSNAFVLRLSGGWRPFADHGFEILAGYTLMTLGGSTTEGDVIYAVLTEAGASQRVTAGSGATIPLSATLHNVHVTLGWRWLLADDHLVIRASLSYLQCLAADVGVSLPSQGQAMETAVNQQLNALVAPYFTQYVKTPLVGLSAGYRF